MNKVVETKRAKILPFLLFSLFWVSFAANDRAVCLAQQVDQKQSGHHRSPSVPSGARAALGRITPDSLRGHLSFIASDLLEGRNTPSRGLDLAAEYIAAQFRRAGLQPAGDLDEHGEKSYFQVADRRGVDPRLGAEDVKVSAASEASEAAQRKPGTLRNVIGLLPGSDPILKDTYLILSAHYDHVGIGKPVDGDAIYNGANDDGSGTVSVVEIASALATLRPKPKRSIVFITWFGEEKGLWGSRYYGQHPIFPLQKTVAMINLEQVGRTDSGEGPQLDSASMTGFDFTVIGSIFKSAGIQTGIKVYKHAQNSDAFFDRSDNQALADAGVPAHTLCVAFDYPDYHEPGDHWEKIDYANMARVDRMVAWGLLLIANNPKAPNWNEKNPKTARYVQAWKTLHQK